MITTLQLLNVYLDPLWPTVLGNDITNGREGPVYRVPNDMKDKTGKGEMVIGAEQQGISRMISWSGNG